MKHFVLYAMLIIFMITSGSILVIGYQDTIKKNIGVEFSTYKIINHKLLNEKEK